MIKHVPSSPAPAGHSSSTNAHEFLASLNRYQANFDLMLSAWRTRDIYDVVTEEFSALLQFQKDFFPDAAMVMIDLVICHNNAAIVLLDLHLSRSQHAPSRLTEADLAARQVQHTIAVVALHNYILKKTH